MSTLRCNIAVYIQLSIADEDTGKSKSESDSSANQHKLINRFLDSHKDLANCQRFQFCDATCIIGINQSSIKRAAICP